MNIEMMKMAKEPSIKRAITFDGLLSRMILKDKYCALLTFPSTLLLLKFSMIQVFKIEENY
jgi:hypothetical protein